MAEEKKKRRRGHNEGTIIQRQDGRWCAAMSGGYKDGKLQRKFYYGATRKEVSDKLDEGRENLKKGIAPVIGRQTLAEYLETWLAECVKPRVRTSTWISYDQQVRVHISPALGHVDLTKLTPQHIQRYMNEKAEPKGKDEPGLSAKTIRYHRSILAMALKQAHRWGLVAQNVATLVDPPSAKKYKLQTFDPAQAHKLLDTLKGERLGALFTVALSLGLRRGEALGLRWQDVDFDARTLRVCQALARVGREIVISEPKTASSRRILPLPETLAASLRERRKQQLEERMAAGDKWTDSGLVFTSRLGEPIDPRTVKRHLDRILTAAKLPHCRVHDLRHFCASLLLAQGVALKIVSEILGHTQISITADLYTHVLPSLKQDAIGALDRMPTAQG
jgi:integrase